MAYLEWPGKDFFFFSLFWQLKMQRSCQSRIILKNSIQAMWNLSPVIGSGHFLWASAALLFAFKLFSKRWFIQRLHTFWFFFFFFFLLLLSSRHFDPLAQQISKVKLTNALRFSFKRRIYERGNHCLIDGISCPLQMLGGCFCACTCDSQGICWWKEIPIWGGEIPVILCCLSLGHGFAGQNAEQGHVILVDPAM